MPVTAKDFWPVMKQLFPALEGLAVTKAVLTVKRHKPVTLTVEFFVAPPESAETVTRTYQLVDMPDEDFAA